MFRVFAVVALALTLHSATSAQTGIVEICKAANGARLENKIFQFRITGVNGIIEVPVNACSSPIVVQTGPQTVTELDSGRTFESGGTFGTFSGGFSMVNVEKLSQNSPSTVGTVNLRARTAQINVAEGGIPQMLTLLITNTYAAKAFIEICNNAPSGSGGFLQYSIEGITGTFAAASNTCTGIIIVRIPATFGAPPATGVVRVTQISKPGFTLETVSTIPSGRFNSLTLGSGINNTSVNCLNAPDATVVAGCVYNNPNGGYADVDVVESANTDGATLIQFNNRVEPTRLLKICKVAGPGVAPGTQFTFDIAVNGEPDTRVIPLTVQARDASGGGTCVFAKSPYDDGLNSFRVGASVTVTERAANGFLLSAVNSPSGGGAVPSVSLTARTATMTLGDGVNTLTFTNITAAPISAPTAAGTNVSVAPTTNLNLTFGTVATAGDTTVSVVPPEQQQPLPSSFALSGAALVYQITTSAVFSGSVVVAFDVPNVADAAACGQLRILHYTNGAWDASSNAAPQYNGATRICTVSQTISNLSSLLANAQFSAPAAASVFAVARLLAPTAARASVGGRVMTENGRGIRGVVVTMTDAKNASRTATTSSFGYYRFDDVAAGETYLLAAKGKRVSFAQPTRILNVGEDVRDADFIGSQR